MRCTLWQAVGSTLSIPAWSGPPPSAAVPEPYCKYVELEMKQQTSPDADAWHGEHKCMDCNLLTDALFPA